ncbi:MAG: NPCBM/NEW2 domain-containing protein [Capsulimonadales bacterium]|nr:NPCBM/NEW2 domain-containing protein [Capsulimonadales bacterium]
MRRCKRSWLIALLLFVLGASGQAREDGAVDGPMEVVYVERLIPQDRTRQFGYEPYRSVQATMYGIVYDHCLMTGVQNHTAPGQRFASITIPLDGSYERFQATLGRDDREHLMGPAYCAFEVYGDGVKLFASDPISSSISPVIVDNAAYRKRKTTQDIDVPVRGVRSLRLVTRYVTEFSQEARFVHRALGCVWANARLIRPKSRSGYDWDSVALRAAIRLTGGLRAKSDGSPVTYRVAITPLRVDPVAARSGFMPASTETELRAAILRQVCAIRHKDGTQYAPLSEEEQKAVTVALPAESPLRRKTEVITAIARGANADCLIFGAVDQRDTAWALTLRLIDVGTGKTLREVTEPLLPGVP